MAIQSWVTTFAGLTPRLPQLVVEKYQRPYSWTEEQIERLFEEHFHPLVDGTDLSHLGDPFVGTVVVMPAGKGAYEIIDGQQRCSTMTMIYAEAYRTLVEAGGSFDHGPASKFLCDKSGDTWIRMKSQDDDIYRVLVLPSGSRLEIDELYGKASFDVVMKYGAKAQGPISTVRNVIVMQLEGYLRHAAERSRLGKAEALVRLLTAIRDSLKIVAVEVDGHGQGLAVFESLNTVGLPLTLEQLIRNCLMKAFNDTASHKVIDQFWDGSGAEGKSLHDSIAKPEHRTEFLMQYYSAFHGPIGTANAYNQFKRLANEVKEGRHHKGLTLWLMHMQNAWRFFATYKGPLRTLGGKAVYPLLLLANDLAWKDEDAREDAINRVAFAVEAALLRTQFCGGNLTALSTAATVLCGKVREGGFEAKHPRELEAFIRQRLAKVVPDDETFAFAVENAPVKHTTRRTELMLRRVNYAEAVGLRDIHENTGMDDKFDADLVHAITPKENPQDSEMRSYEFKDYGEYFRLTKSLANVIISPSSGTAARVPANMGVSTNKASYKLLKSRSRKLATLATKIWSMG